MPSLTLLDQFRAAVVLDRRILPTPLVDLSRMTHYRGGTNSHTVDTIVFADGSSARTDLIRLNPNIAAYSLDFNAVAPARPSRYVADSWAAVPHLAARAHEAEVDWILRHSHPVLSTVTLSDRLRRAGYPLGPRNITEHEAIAGTQAAIWFLTNGLELDDRPLDVPIRVTQQAGAVEVEFDEDVQLGGYSVKVSTLTGAVLTLQKSVDGQSWDDVDSSTVSVPAGGAVIAKTLGVGSTLSHNRFVHRGVGHRHYRLLVEGDAAVTDPEFGLDGSARYRNAEPIVHLYRYLLAGACAAREAARTPSVTVDDAQVTADLVGPLRLEVASAAMVTAPEGIEIVHGGKAAASALIAPDGEFFLHVPPEATGATLTVEVPGGAEGFGGRVLTGVVRDHADGHFTPLALAVPVSLVVEFDVNWGAY